MSAKKFTEDNKDCLRGGFAAKRIALSESSTAVRDRCLEKLKDVSQDLFTNRFKEVKEDCMMRTYSLLLPACILAHADLGTGPHLETLTLL